MGVLDEFKQEAAKNGTKVQTPIERQLEAILNRTFYLEKNIEEETKFIKHIMTRGAETQERIGLHASAIIDYPSKYCERKQLLSLLYRQDQGSQIDIGLMRIFEEGNAIHEKWQRLFIRAGWSKYTDLDRTILNERYQLSFTPDIICTIPEFSDKQMIVEIKSMNTYSFKKQNEHSSGRKQLMLYMYLTGIHQGFVLMEDKNTQEFKVKYYEFDPKEVELPVQRLNKIKYLYDLQSEQGYANIDSVRKHEKCDNADSKFACDCAMRDACFNCGKGKRLIEEVSMSEEELEEWKEVIEEVKKDVGISVWNF